MKTTPKSVQTAATGTNWAAFTAFPQVSLVKLVNDTGTSIMYRLNGSTITLTLASGESSPWIPIEDLSFVSVKRTDDSNTQVTVKALCALL